MARRSTKLPLALGLLLPFAALGVQWLLWGLIKPCVWLLFYPTVFFCSRIGGKLVGIVSTLLSSLLVVPFFLSPQLPFASKDGSHLACMLVFIAMGVAFSFTQERLGHKAETGDKLRSTEAELLAARGTLRLLGMELSDARREANERLRRERKDASAALREIEVGRSLALDAAQAGTWEWDLASGKNLWSEELWKLYGLPVRGCAPSYESWLQTVHPDDRGEMVQTLAELIPRGAEVNLEWRVNGAGHSQRWLMSRGRPLSDASGSVVRYLGVAIDITQRKAAENQLKLRNEELERFDLATVERELEMIRLKRTVNDLSSRLGLAPPHDLSFADEAGAGSGEER